MKRQLTALTLFGVAFGAWLLPAVAEVNVSFGRHDSDHDGRWNYREFHNANRYYYHQNPQVEVVRRRDLHRDYRRLDTNYDGYLSPGEVQTYHTW